ncbi:MAG TPA: response regulator [Chitinophagales bacterium]|nr:response regulator [Chitinophagales bacterium]
MFRVLIVDDEPVSAAMIRSMLQKHFPLLSVSGVASNINEALSHLQNQPVELVLLDIELHKQSGFDLLDKTRNRNWQFIMLSASNEHACKTFEYGGSGYLLKPVSEEELALSLSHVFGKDFSAFTHILSG